MNKTKWIEYYRNCSCSTEEGRKKDLPGYCPRHGSERREVLKFEFAGTKQPDFIIRG